MEALNFYSTQKTYSSMLSETGPIIVTFSLTFTSDKLELLPAASTSSLLRPTATSTEGSTPGFLLTMTLVGDQGPSKSAPSSRTLMTFTGNEQAKLHRHRRRNHPHSAMLTAPSGPQSTAQSSSRSYFVVIVFYYIVGPGIRHSVQRLV